MKTMTRSIFESALLDAVLEGFADIPENEDDIDWEFSPQFLEKMEALIRKTKRRTWHYVNTTAKRILLVAIISVLLACSAMAIPGVRNAVIRFFAAEKGPKFEFTFDAAQRVNVPEQIETVFFPAYIPEGYHKLENYWLIDRSQISVAWEDGNHAKEYIMYAQSCLPKSPDPTGFALNADNVETQTLILGYYEVFYVHHLGAAQTYSWTNDEYFFTLSFPEQMTQEDMQKIFFSIHAVPEPSFDEIE